MIRVLRVPKKKNSLQGFLKIKEQFENQINKK